MPSPSLVRAVCAAAAFLLASHASAAPQPVSLAPIGHASASLVVVDGEGQEVTFDPAGLEQLDTYHMTTRTPWREEPADFEGILLSELLERHGLADLDEIVVSAENDYQVRIPRIAWTEMSLLIATRVDGRPHSRRARGPIQFVLSEEDRASPFYSEDYLVWMAARIEPAGH